MTLQLEPASPADPACQATGQDVYAVTVVARKSGEEALRRAELIQLHSLVTEPVVLRTSSVDKDEIVANGEKNVGLWGTRVEIGTIASCGGRKLTVSHAGTMAHLSEDGAPSSEMSGADLSGQWELRSPLNKTEQLQPSSRPRLLKLLVRGRCRQEPQ